jgi:EAL domain-containing protein (putative c-di-GMP-specific phosphodiesterase class I)/CheY-like chemotaxis protein
VDEPDDDDDVTPTTPSARVLTVDDDPLILALVRRTLSRAGFAVDSAADGREALSQIAANRYDVIVTDVRMPTLGGLDLLRAVRSHDLDVPIVLMTGKPDFDSAHAAVEYGAFRYVVKPFDPRALLAVVEHAATFARVARLRREASEMAGETDRQLGDRASLDARFEKALAGIYMAYQPIVECHTERVLAYEALVRSDEPALASAPGLLDAAQRLGRAEELGRRIRACVAAAANKAPPDALLCVNVSAAELSDDELYDPEAPLSRIADRVVLEITERATFDSVDRLSARRYRLGELGYRIAIDDLGAGYAGLATFARLEPEFVKLDASLVREVDKRPRKLRLVEGMTALCMRLKMRVVAEGVETRSELDALVRAGVDLCQGHLFGKPERAFAAPQWASWAWTESHARPDHH